MTATRDMTAFLSWLTSLWDRLQDPNPPRPPSISDFQRRRKHRSARPVD